MTTSLRYIALIGAVLVAGFLAFITWETAGGRERCLKEMALPKHLEWYAQELCNQRYGKRE